MPVVIGYVAWRRDGKKWDAKTSSLYQVLVSIQGLILVDDPMFNEPGSDGIRDGRGD